MKILTGLIGFMIMMLAVSFALVNRQSVSISLWPFSKTSPVPLYLLTLGTFLVGLLIGAAFVWVTHVPHRMRSRRMQKDMKSLQAKFDALKPIPMPQTVIPPHIQDDDDDLEPRRPVWRKFK